MKIDRLKNHTTYDSNPFIIKLQNKMFLQPRVNTFLAKGEKVVNVLTGEELDEKLLLGRRKLIDKSQFAKLYVTEIGLLFDLSKTAMNVFLYLMKAMDFENKVLFDYLKEFKKAGYKTKASCLSGIKELLNAEIIVKHTIDGVYWVNPVVVCKGERFATYTEYVTKEQNAKDTEKQKILQNAIIENI